LRDGFAVVVHEAESELRFRVPLLMAFKRRSLYRQPHKGMGSLVQVVVPLDITGTARVGRWDIADRKTVLS
jgi:hypothetical protein